jgi:hypothetical protein
VSARCCARSATSTTHSLIGTATAPRDAADRSSSSIVSSNSPRSAVQFAGTHPVPLPVSFERVDDKSNNYNPHINTEIEVLVFDAPHYSRIGYMPKV